MIDWNWNVKNKHLMVEEWGHSDICWQERNREILNKAIRSYNNYVTGEKNDLDYLDEVVRLIKYAEKKLFNEPGTYLEDIKFMKESLFEILIEDEEE